MSWERVWWMTDPSFADAPTAEVDNFSFLPVVEEVVEGPQCWLVSKEICICIGFVAVDVTAPQVDGLHKQVITTDLIPLNCRKLQNGI